MGLVYQFSQFTVQKPESLHCQLRFKHISLYHCIKGIFSIELYKDNKKLIDYDRIHTMEWDYMQITQL